MMAPAGAGTPTKKLAVQAGRSGSSSITLKRASRSAAQIANTIAAIQPADLQIVQPPEIEDQRRRHAEIDEIREAVELGAEARGSLQKPRQPAVDGLEDGGENNGGERQHP